MKNKCLAVCMAVMVLFGCMHGYAASFDDVGEAHAWAKTDIESYAERGILAGDGLGHFFPDNSVTRAEFAKMLCLVFGLDKAEEITYTDVDKDSWQYDYIAKTDKYTYTESKENYAPDAPATRAEIAYAIVNAAGIKAEGVELPFADADEILPALTAHVDTAYALGLLKGYPDNTFRPNAPVTRAEVVVLLARAEAAMAEKPPVEEPKEEEKPEVLPSVPEAETMKVEPMDTLCYVVNAWERFDDSEDAIRYRVQFYVAGSETLYEMYIDKDVPMNSMYGTAQKIQGGDIILINTNLYGEVKEVFLMLRIGTMPLAFGVSTENAFLEKLNVPTAHKWGFLEEDKKHEVYLGFLGDIQYDKDGAKIYIYPGNGRKSSDATRVLRVAEDAKILTYEANLRTKNHYGFATADTLEVYGAPKDDYGNIIQETANDWKVYQYVFVKAKDGVVTDILVISNQ